MPNWSRRRTLQAAAATATAALAGCNGSTERSDTTGRRREGDPVTDYDAETVRDPDGRSLFRQEDAAGDEDSRGERQDTTLLTDPLAESDLAFTADAPAADVLQSFVTDTDFERQSVLVFTTRVSGCQTLRIQDVRRGTEAVDVSFCRPTRDASVACDADADHTAGVAVRLPFPAEGTNALGVRVSGDCRAEPEPLTLDGGGDS